jgi:dsDNA-specific endonuclease/ATPase MutS2
MRSSRSRNARNAEVHRILLALTDAFRGRPDDLDTLLEAAAVLDELHAKARFAGPVDGVAPELTTEGHLEFRAARHPLLIPSVRDLLGNVGAGACHRIEPPHVPAGPGAGHLGPQHRR